MTPQVSGREFTVEDLDGFPDDGRRRELIDGALVMTPSPRREHQRVVVELGFLIKGLLPRELEVLVAPFDVRIGPRTNLQPDVFVARSAELTDMSLPAPPLLVVEVLSPSTRHIDLGLKKSAYESLGTPSYWVVDPAVPAMIAWELRDGSYIEVGRAQGDEVLELSRPIPIRIVPAELVP